MLSSPEVFLHIQRAAYLLGLAVLPGQLSPDPVLADSALAAALSALAVLAVLGLAYRLRTALDTLEAKAAAVLVWVAVAVAFGAALYFRGPEAPLGRGLPVAAAAAWIALATVAAALAGRFLGSSFKQKRTAAAVIVLVIGVAQLRDAGKVFASTESMWSEALRRDGEHEAAIDALVAPARKGGKLDDAAKVVAKCLKTHPASCTCLAVSAEIASARRKIDEAGRSARAAVDKCPDSLRARAALAEALALAGDGIGAEQEARAGLEAGGDGESRLHYALALALNVQGKYPESLAAAQRAIELGAGRDASLLAGALAILGNDLDAATKLLEPLVKADANDADAAYDLALVADKRGDYNAARQGYLAALRADPKLANARFNLAQLTHRQGVSAEAQHHAQKFVEGWPADARGADLLRLTGAAVP